MTDDYTPTTDEVRHAYTDGLSGTSRSRAESGSEFDRWLAKVRKDEREKVAAEIETVADSEPQIIGFRCTFPGPREPGLRAAARIARGGAS